MIQRIQSIWLFLAAVCTFLTINLSFYSGTNAIGVPYQQLNAGNGGFLLLALTIIIGTLAFVNIFMFKNRRLQLRLCVAGIVLEAVLLFLYYKAVTLFTQGTYSLTALLHSAILIFFMLAARGIKKDEDLIRDSERLR